MGRFSRMARTLLLALSLTAALLLVACASSATVGFEPDGGSYDEQSIDSVLTETDISHLEEVAADEAPEMRREALVELRAEGDDASNVADLLMEGFPVQTRAVPGWVEGATFMAKTPG
jgi:hypothetical protein